MSADRVVTKVRPYGNNVSKTVIRGGVSRQVQAVAGDELLFQFKHGRIDLSSLNLRFDFATVGPDANNGVPPPDLLINTLEVRIGDVVLNRIRNYDQLMSIIWVYGSDVAWQLDRMSFTNQHTGGRGIAHVGTNRSRYTVNRFLGFLAQDSIIDTRDFGGPLSIRIILGDNNSVSQNVSQSTWGWDNIHFLTTYINDDAPVNVTKPANMVWDDYTGTSRTFAGYKSNTRLIVDSWGGGATIQHLLARQLNLSTLTTKPTILDATTGLVPSFQTTGNNLATWNFNVNNKNVMDEDGDLADFLPSLKRVFPNATMYPQGGNNINFADHINNKQCAFGAVVNVPQPAGEQVEVAFYTEPAASGVAVPQTTFLWAKSLRKWM